MRISTKLSSVVNITNSRYHSSRTAVFAEGNQSWMGIVPGQVHQQGRNFYGYQTSTNCIKHGMIPSCKVELLDGWRLIHQYWAIIGLGRSVKVLFLPTELKPLLGTSSQISTFLTMKVLQKYVMTTCLRST